MKRQKEMVLKAFLSQLPQDREEALRKFLPSREQEALNRLPAHFPQLSAEEDLVSRVHWSWFLPTLKSYPETDRKFFLASLSRTAIHNLSHILESEEEETSLIGKKFLHEVLRQSLAEKGREPLPASLLPASPLNILLPLSKKELTQLIDRLSFFDLAHELHQIVETIILKKIYSFLTEDERKVLKTLSTHREPYPIPRLGLDRWDGEKESFRLLLHRRGLARLGAALSGQEPDLIWYVCHQLDIGRGAALHKLCVREAMPPFSEWAIEQIEKLLRDRTWMV